MTDDRTMVRRAAVVAICEPAARSTVARVVDEAVRAASIFGLTRERADAYADGILSTLPLAFEGMAMADGPERTARTRQLAAAVRAVSDSHHIPSLVERGLVSIALRIAREVVRRGAERQGFTPDELEREFVAFAHELEDALYREDEPRPDKPADNKTG
jgi:hypothetical protein